MGRSILIDGIQMRSKMMNVLGKLQETKKLVKSGETVERTYKRIKKYTITKNTDDDDAKFDIIFNGFTA